MSEDNKKFVDFDEYCPKCKYELNKEEEDPCWDCLSIPARENSKKPEMFKSKEN